MANGATKFPKERSDWGQARRGALRAGLALSLIAGVSTLQAQSSDRAGVDRPAISASQVMASAGDSQATSDSALSVSAFSAARSQAARMLLTEQQGGESNRAVGIQPLPATPAAEPSSAAPRRGQAVVRQLEAAEAREAEQTAMVARSLRAFGRDEEQVGSPTPRRRAAFSSAISRAAAAGALTSSNPTSSIGNALSASRFTPARNPGQFDPGFADAAEVLSVVPGLRLESATIFGGYSSNSLPRGFGTSSAYYFPRNTLGADYDLGASAVLSYSHQGRRGMTRLSYAPSHVQRSRIPEWSTTDHRLSFQSSRDLTPRLSLRATGNAVNTGMEQFWARPAVLRSVEAPASFNELLEKVQAGEISNDEFAAILTGSPVVDDPGGAEYDVNRVFAASLATGMSYAYSRRMTLNFGAGSSMSRVVATNFSGSAGDSRYLNYARITNANAAADYRLSSRTRVGVSHVTAFTDSTFTRSVSHSPTVSLSQRLSRHWSYEVGGGVGTIRFDAHNGILQGQNWATTTWTANGMLGYAKGAHNVNLGASKRVGDPNGFGGRATMQANLTWNWQPRFSPWGATAGIAFSRTDFSARGSRFGQNFATDLYSAGFSRRLAPSTTFRTDYYYGEYLSPFTGIASNMALHRMQLSLVWRPVEQR